MSCVGSQGPLTARCQISHAADGGENFGLLVSVERLSGCCFGFALSAKASVLDLIRLMGPPLAGLRRVSAQHECS